MRWFIVSALFLFSFSCVLNAQCVNRHSNKTNRRPILPRFTVKTIFWASSWPSYTGHKNHWSGQLWYKYVGTTTKARDLSYFVNQQRIV
jgi:hypothetical protein